MAYMVVCGMTIHDRLTTTTQEYNLRLMFAPLIVGRKRAIILVEEYAHEIRTKTE